MCAWWHRRYRHSTHTRTDRDVRASNSIGTYIYRESRVVITRLRLVVPSDPFEAMAPPLGYAPQRATVKNALLSVGSLAVNLITPLVHCSCNCNTQGSFATIHPSLRFSSSSLFVAETLRCLHLQKLRDRFSSSVFQHF